MWSMQNVPDLNSLSHEQKDELILTLWAQLQNVTAQLAVMQERIVQLEARLSLNSKNSSKPPSTGGLVKPNPKSLRVGGLRPTGGQKGHDGNTLRQSTHVDQIISHHGASACPNCQREWLEHAVIERRQVFELHPGARWAGGLQAV